MHFSMVRSNDSVRIGLSFPAGLGGLAKLSKMFDIK